jgi:preprotein translocase subunit SecD
MKKHSLTVLMAILIPAVSLASFTDVPSSNQFYEAINYLQTEGIAQGYKNGARLFEEITARNIGKPLAIFVEGQLISAPNVIEKISGGKAMLSGTFTYEEAQNLAADLNKGINP